MSSCRSRALNKAGCGRWDHNDFAGAIETIKTAVEELGDEAIIGVGSVLDAETARMAIMPVRSLW